MTLSPIPVLVASLMQSAPQPVGPMGHWVNPQGSVILEIAECGEQALCGWVRWASEAAEADVKAAGGDRLVGTLVFHRFVAAGNERWKGPLFVPDLRRTHAAEFRLIDDTHLKVSGCAVARLICKSQLWTRTRAIADNPPTN